MPANSARRGDTDQLDEIARILAVSLRLEIGSQSMAIVELSKAGIGPSRIAELLGTTPGTVNVALQRAKKKPSRRAGEED